MKPHFIFTLMCLALLCSAQPTHAQDTATPAATAAPLLAARRITVRGRVVNGTAGAKLPASLKLTLHVFGVDETKLIATGPELLASPETEMASDGIFSFANVPSLPGHTYIVTASYAGGIQSAAPVTPALSAAGQLDKSEIEVSFTIYEASSDPSTVRATKNVTILDFASFPGEVQVFSGYDFAVSGDRMYLDTVKRIEGKPVSAWVNVAPDAQGVSAAGKPEKVQPDKTRFLIAEGQVHDTLPIMPGILHRLSVSYRVRYIDRATFAQKLPFGGSDMQVLIPAINDKIKLTGDGFSAGEPYSLGTDLAETFVLYRHLAPLEPGKTLTFEIKGTPPEFKIPEALLPPPNPLPILLAAGGAILLLAAVVILLKPRRKPKSDTTSQS